MHDELIKYLKGSTLKDLDENQIRSVVLKNPEAFDAALKTIHKDLYSDVGFDKFRQGYSRRFGDPFASAEAPVSSVESTPLSPVSQVATEESGQASLGVPTQEEVSPPQIRQDATNGFRPLTQDDIARATEQTRPVAESTIERQGPDPEQRPVTIFNTDLKTSPADLSDPNRKTYFDLNSFESKALSPSEVREVLSAMAADKFGEGATIQNISPEDQKQITREFTSRYIQQDDLQRYLDDNQLDLNISEFGHAARQFARGAVGTFASASEMASQIDRSTSVGPLPGVLTAIAPATQVLGGVENIAGVQADVLNKAVDDIKTNPKYAGKFESDILPQALGSAAAFVGTGAATGGSRLAVGALGAFSNGGQLYKEAKNAGADDADAMIAGIIGMGIGATEAISLGPIASRFVKPASGVAKKSGENVLFSILKDARNEGLQEVGQSLANNATAKFVFDNTREIANMEVAESGAAGFVVGALLGAGGVATQRILTRNPSTEELELVEKTQELIIDKASEITGKEVSTIEEAIGALEEKLGVQPEETQQAEVAPDPVTEETDPVVETVPETEAEAEVATEVAVEPETETVSTAVEEESAPEEDIEPADFAIPPETEGAAKELEDRKIREAEKRDRDENQRKKQEDGKLKAKEPEIEEELPKPPPKKGTFRDQVSRSIKEEGFDVGKKGIVVVPEDLVQDDAGKRRTLKGLRLLSDDLSAQRDELLQDETITETAKRSRENHLVNVMDSIDAAIEGLSTEAAPAAQQEAPIAETKTPEPVAVEEKAAPVAQEKPANSIPDKYTRAASDAKRKGLTDSDIQSVVSAVQNGERTPEADKVAKSPRGKDLISKQNRLLTDYIRIKSKASKDAEKAKEERGGTGRTIAIELKGLTKELHDTGSAGEREAAKKGSIADQVQSQADPKKKAVSRDRQVVLTKFNNDILEIGPAASRADAVAAFEEALKKAPALNKLYKGLQKDILALPSVTSAAAKQFGFKTKEAFAKAIASKMMFDRRSREKGDFTTFGEDNRLEHFAVTQMRDVQPDIGSIQEWASLGEKAQEGTHGEPIDPGDEATVTRATRLYLDKLYQHLRPLFPNINVFYRSQEAFDAAAEALGRNPKTTKGFYFDGSIYINPEMATQDTLIHEYAHVWMFMIRNRHHQLYTAMERELSGSNQYARQYQKAIDGGLNDADASMEAMAQIIGSYTAKRYNKIAESSKFKRLLNSIFEKVMSLFNIPKTAFLAGVSSATRKAPINLARARMRNFLDLASRELLSKSELSIMSELGLAEFTHAGLSKHIIVQGGAITSHDRMMKSETDTFGHVPASTAEKIRIFLSDTNLMLKNVQKEIAKARNVPPHEILDLHGEFELLSGLSKHKIDQAMIALTGNSELRSAKGRKQSFDASLIGRAKKDGISWTDLSLYLHARHARERNEKVRQIVRDRVAKLNLSPEKEAAKIKEQMIQEGSGMSDLEAARVMASFETGRNAAKYEQYASEIEDLLIKPARELMLESGLINEDTKTALEDNFQFYVPLLVLDYKGPHANMVAPATTGGTFPDGVRGAGIHNIKGTDKYHFEQRMDVISAILQKYKETVIRAEKNKVLNKMANLIRENPHQIWNVKGVKYKPTVNEQGEVVDVKAIPLSAEQRKTTVPFLEEGKLRHIQILDTNLMEALRGRTIGDGWAQIRSLLQKYTAFRRSVLTTLSPAFVFSNVTRDMWTALTLIDGFVEGKSVKADLVSNMRSSYKAIKNRELGIEGDSKAQRALEEMLESGGEISWLAYEGVEAKLEQYIKVIDKERKRATASPPGRFIQSAKSFGKAAVDGILLYNKIAEQSVRLSAYMVARDNGKTAKEASIIAKNITVNFNKRGIATPWLNTIFLFSNAGIQGTLNMWDMVTDSSRSKASRAGGFLAKGSFLVAKNMIALTTASFFLNVINDLIAGDDDEELNKITDGEKRNNVHFLFPFTGGTKAFTLPLGYGMNIPKVLGDQLYDVASGKKGITEGALEVFYASQQTINPFGSESSLVHGILPDIIKPIYEHTENVQYGGVPIRPEQPFGIKRRDSQNYFKSVSEPSKWFTNWMANATGADGDLHGAIEVSPETIDYATGFFLGGMGRFFSRSAGFAGQIADYTLDGDKEAININKAPIISRFFQDMPKVEWRDSKIFHEGHQNAAKDTYTKKQMELIDISRRNLLRKADDQKKRAAINRKYKEIIRLQNLRKAK